MAVGVLKSGAQVSAADLLDSIRPKFARFWIPDDVVFIEALPRTSTGKFLKSALRAQFKDYSVSAQA